MPKRIDPIRRSYLAALLIVLGGTAIGCQPNEQAPFPTEVLISSTSPDGESVARIVRYRPAGGTNLLRTDVQLFLSIERNGNEVIATRDLSEGFGEYEGGVHELIWGGPSTIVVRRSVADRQADIVFDIGSLKWRQPKSLE